MPSSYTTDFKLPLERTRRPGLFTLTVHCGVIVVLLAVLGLLWPFRALSSVTAEALIRVSDATADALRERMSR